MARKKQNFLSEDLKAISEQLEVVEKLLDRTKVLYEQYFMGIHKMPPSQLHRDIERKVRELTQLQIRNTSLRYRLTNVTQKFGVYNTYWRRILRQIEQGKYVRDVARVQRRARRKGEDVPEEILAAMPKRMRDRVLRDRELLAKRAERAGHAGHDSQVASDAGHGKVRNPRANAHQVGDDMLDDDLDIDALFANLTSQAESAVDNWLEQPEPAPSRLDPRPELLTRAPDPSPAPPTVPANEAPAGKRSGAPSPVDDENETTRPFTAIPRSETRKRATTVPPPVPADAQRPTKRAPTAPPVPEASPARKPLAPSRPRPASDRSTRPRPQSAAPSRAGALPPGMTEDKARALYQRYLQARKQVGKSTDVRYTDLVKSLNRQAPALMKRHKAKAVEFDVAVQGGKVILKAKPKR